MNGPLLISLLSPEQIGEAAKATPDQVPYVVAILLLANSPFPLDASSRTLMALPGGTLRETPLSPQKKAVVCKGFAVRSAFGVISLVPMEGLT
jgi:hypothetical protein